MSGSWIIGKNPECDYVVNQGPVSGRHCRLIRDESAVSLEDLGSTNGTYVNGVRLLASDRHPLSTSDRVNLGSHSIEAAELLEFVDRMDPPELVYREGEMVIGRAAGCELEVGFPSVSSRHARLYRSGDRLYLEDLGSANGTFVNGERISVPTVVKAGDRISLGTRTFVLREAILNQSAAPRELAGSVGPASLAERAASTSVAVERALGSGVVHPSRLALLLLQAPLIVGLVRGLATGRPGEPGRAVFLFGLALASVWFGLSAPVLGGRADSVARPGSRDGEGGRRRSSHLLLLCGLAIAQCALAWAVAAASGGVSPGDLPALGMLVLGSGVGLALGLLVVGVAPGRTAALASALVILVLSGLMGGQVRPIHEWPAWARPASGLVPARWVFEGLLVTEAGEPPSTVDRTSITESYFPAASTRMGLMADGLALTLMLVGVGTAAMLTVSSPSGRHP